MAWQYFQSGCFYICHHECLYSSVAERWSCKPKVMSSILIGGKIFFVISAGKKQNQACCIHPVKIFTLVLMKASIAQWQSVGLVNQRSWVQSSLEANDFCKRRQAKYIFLVGPPPFNNFDGVGKQKSFMTPTWFEHAAFWSGVRRATVAPRSHTDKSCSKRLRFYRDLNSDRWIQSPEC